MAVIETIPPVVAVPALLILIFFTVFIESRHFKIFNGIIERKAIRSIVNLMLVTILCGGVGIMAALVPRMFCFPITTAIMEILLILVSLLAIQTSFLWTIASVLPGKIKKNNLVIGIVFMGLAVAPAITIMRFNTWGLGITCLFNSCGGLICL